MASQAGRTENSMSLVNPGMVSGHVWNLPHGAGASNDLAAFWHALNDLVRRGDWQVRELGPVMGHPLPLLVRQVRADARCSVLVAAGFHGEEPAGPWGLLQFLASRRLRIADGLRLAVLPLVNATGFAAGRRFNDLGQNPNRGYGRGDLPRHRSIEGRVLRRHWRTLRRLGADGVLSCHEHREATHAYAYTYEPYKQPGAFSRALVQALGQHMPLHPDGLVDGCRVRGGVVYNQTDGSFESQMAVDGVPATACLETPGMRPFATRQRAQSQAIEAFIAQRAAAGARVR